MKWSPLPRLLTALLLTLSFLLTGCSAWRVWPVKVEAGELKVAAATEETGLSCDSKGFLKAAAEAEKLRVKHRVSAETFARMAKEPGTIVLDARDAGDHERLRVKGSISLPYTLMAQESLRKVIPDLDTRVLIYCRNNIMDWRPPAKPNQAGDVPYPMEFDPPQIPKTVGAGLNIPTYITLYIYGYRNIYELDPAVDPNNSPIEFVSGPEKRR